MASPGMFKRLNPQTGAYEYSQVLPDGTTKFYSSLDQLKTANPGFDDPGEITEIPYNPSAPHPTTTPGGIPINTSVAAQNGAGYNGSSINNNPVITGDYAADLTAYRKANPYQDSQAWLQALAPEQQAWMAANPGKGNNPVNPNSSDPSSPFFVPPRSVNAGFDGKSPMTNQAGAYGQGKPPGAVGDPDASGNYHDAFGRPVSWNSYQGAGDPGFSADTYSGAGLGFNLSEIPGMSPAIQANIQKMIASSGGVTGAVNNSGSDPIIAMISRSLLAGQSPDQVLQNMQGQVNQYTMPSLQQIQQVAAGMTQAGFKLDGSMAPQQSALAQKFAAKAAANAGGATPPGTPAPSGTAGASGNSAWDAQLRQTYMDSPLYNPNGANTWGIQNSPISSLNNAFGGQIGGNGQPTPGNLAQASGSAVQPQAQNPTQMPSMPTQQQAPIADGGTNGSKPFNSSTAFGGATSGWNPTPTPQTPAPTGPTWGAQSPVKTGGNNGGWFKSQAGLNG